MTGKENKSTLDEMNKRASNKERGSVNKIHPELLLIYILKNYSSKVRQYNTSEIGNIIASITGKTAPDTGRKLGDRNLQNLLYADINRSKEYNDAYYTILRKQIGGRILTGECKSRTTYYFENDTNYRDFELIRYYLDAEDKRLQENGQRPGLLSNADIKHLRNEIDRICPAGIGGDLTGSQDKDLSEICRGLRHGHFKNQTFDSYDDRENKSSQYWVNSGESFLRKYYQLYDAIHAKPKQKVKLVLNYSHKSDQGTACRIDVIPQKLFWNEGSFYVEYIQAKEVNSKEYHIDEKGVVDIRNVRRIE